MATENQRAYAKGYGSGYRRSSRWAQKLIAACRLAQARAERAEIAGGIGHCRDCRYCMSSPTVGAMFGNCTRYADGAQAVDDPWFGEANSKLFPRVAPPVSLNFGCVLFEPRPQ